MGVCASSSPRDRTGPLSEASRQLAATPGRRRNRSGDESVELSPCNEDARSPSHFPLEDPVESDGLVRRATNGSSARAATQKPEKRPQAASPKESKLTFKNVPTWRGFKKTSSSSSKLSSYALQLIAEVARDDDLAAPDAPTDPIMLTKIRRNSPTFTFLRPTVSSIGTVDELESPPLKSDEEKRDEDTARPSVPVVYRVSTLVEFMLVTGTFVEPETRIPFSDDDLLRLDEIGKGLGLQSVMDAKNHGMAMYKERRETEDALTGVERLAGDQVGKLVRTIERTFTKGIVRGQEIILGRVLPNLRHYLEELFRHDVDGAKLVTEQMRIFIVGPPNRRTRDHYNGELLKFALLQFDEMVKATMESVSRQNAPSIPE